DGDDVTYLHHLADLGPRAWVVHQVEIIPGDDQTIERISDWQFEPLDAAILPEPLNASLAGAEEVPDSSAVRWVRREPAHLILDVVLPADGLLVLGEVHYPGWQTYVDGNPTPTLRANLALRAVPVPAGQHQVEMVYRPWTVPAGIAISVLALMGAVAVIVASTRRDRRATDGSV
ncbi:MAG: YfhO family protein, partial [Anaerolineae bacterium]|nr:YfhO family protein [Anaerolineae bacterium]